MKIHKLNCPNCNGILEIKIVDNTSSVYCLYCGQPFIVDNEKKEHTTNKNIKYQKNLHKRYTNDAEVIKAINEDKENKRVYLLALLPFIVLLIMGVTMYMDEKKAISEGKINAGYYQDLIGQDYKAVKAHFESAGFTNIELVNLNDAGLALWKNKKVEIISVGGNTSFDSSDFFDPDTKVVISYH